MIVNKQSIWCESCMNVVNKQARAVSPWILQSWRAWNVAKRLGVHHWSPHSDIQIDIIEFHLMDSDGSLDAGPSAQLVVTYSISQLIYFILAADSMAKWLIVDCETHWLHRSRLTNAILIELVSNYQPNFINHSMIQLVFHTIRTRRKSWKS